MEFDRKFKKKTAFKKRGAIIMGRNLLLTAVLVLGLVAALQLNVQAEPPMDHYISTGDNHFVATFLPIESPNSIAASFDLLKELWGVRRVYWRGLQESVWIETHQPREGAHPRTSDFFIWCDYLINDVNIEQVAVQAAHDRGMELWGYGSIGDFGSTGAVPGGSYGVPFGHESILRIEHPEWVPVGKYGVFKQGGPIEMAYPQARQAVIDIHVNHAVNDGYDGISFLTYAEQYSMRFQEEFGYNDPIVEEFENRYGVDIRTEPFNKTDWINLRGEYVTQFLRELKTALSVHGIKLGMSINQHDPNRTQPWPYTGTILRTAGEVNMDYETWIDDQLVDELLVWGSGASAAQMLAQLAQGTPTEVSIATSNPYYYQYLGIPVVGMLGDDTGYLLRSTIYPQLLSALSDPNQYKRMCVLAQIIDGQTSAVASDVLPLTSDSNLLVRRMALRALGVIGDSVALPTLEAAILDPESAIRNGAIIALQYVRGSNTFDAVLNAVDQYGNHMFNERAVYALIYCTPASTTRANLAEAMQNHNNPMVREIAARALTWMPNPDVVSALTNTLANDPCNNVRQYAAEALGNISGNSQAVQALIDAVGLDNVTVSERAAICLGKMFERFDAAALAKKQEALDALGALYTELGRWDCQRSDVDWGYRPLGRALLATGSEGYALLQSYYKQTRHQRLAQMAWLTLYLPHPPGDFTIYTEEQNDAAFEKRPLIFNRMTDVKNFCSRWLESGLWP